MLDPIFQRAKDESKNCEKSRTIAHVNLENEKKSLTRVRSSITVTDKLDLSENEKSLSSLLKQLETEKNNLLLEKGQLTATIGKYVNMGKQKPLRSEVELRSCLNQTVLNEIEDKGLTMKSITKELNEHRGHNPSRLSIVDDSPPLSYDLPELISIANNYKGINLKEFQKTTRSFTRLTMDGILSIRTLLKLYNDVRIITENDLHDLNLDDYDSVNESLIYQMIDKIKTLTTSIDNCSDYCIPSNDVNINDLVVITGLKLKKVNLDKYKSLQEQLSLKAGCLEEIIDLIDGNGELTSNHVKTIKKLLIALKDGKYTELTEMASAIENNKSCEQSALNQKYKNYSQYCKLYEEYEQLLTLLTKVQKDIYHCICIHISYSEAVNESILWHKNRMAIESYEKFQLYTSYSEQLSIVNDLHYYDNESYINQLTIVDEGLMSVNSKISNTTKQLNKLSIDLDQYDRSMDLIKFHETNIDRYQNEYKILSDKFEMLKISMDIFSPNNLPFKLLSGYLSMFCQNTNLLFTKLIGYKLTYAQEKDKLYFYLNDEHDPLSLSGYESVSLTISMNNALEALVRGKFLIIDESFDCIDQDRFINELPDTINMIKKYYQSMLLISHRDLPEDIIDNNIKIRSYGKYSVIKN